MRANKGLYLDGRWASSTSSGTIDVENPTTRELIGTVPDGSPADVEVAVRAAHDAFPGWAASDPKDRVTLLRDLAEILQRRNEEVASTITREVGTPHRVATRIQASLPITDITTYADYLEAGIEDERVGNSLVVREPVGVIAAITPWNYPLHQITCKIGPALAAGCSVVVKPSEIAPLTANLLFDALHEAGFPPGVVNLVHGRGATVGEALAGHPMVDGVSFTGSVTAGRRVAGLAAATVKRVTLELGGKSANVILPDADLITAVKIGVANAFLNAGQTCTSWTRMLVSRNQAEEAAAMARECAESYVPGDPTDPATKLGPLVSQRQRERVLDYIAAGLESGATLVTGGLEPPEGVPDGYFVRPTVFAGVDPASTIAQEEIFGPVLSIISYTDEAEALAIANGTHYGLHGAVWSRDQERALRFARRMRTGQVDINGGAYNPRAPFGGYGQSGVGREMGRAGLDEYVELKSIQL